ncbi:MAG: hypothetical protein H6664_15180 [Ardenticatenaceae bacterium]|nr:hypothetical protein [Ardenticatenaceae bacterium]
MKASDAQAYIGRWQAVAELKQQEQQTVSLAQNWQRLNAIKQRASRLDIARQDDDGEMDIFLLWAKLRAEYVSN